MPPKLDGSAKYGIDVFVPNMVYAIPLQNPTRIGSTPKAVDESAAKKIDGYVGAYVNKEGFTRVNTGYVVAIGETYWAAEKAAKALKIDWDLGENKNISSDDTKVLVNLKRNLKLSIFGQDKAIDELSRVVKLSRSGLRDDNKTIGSYLFVGPTGVGKTEIAKVLSSVLNIDLLRFDMSEYMERHSISRLIGSPPGYVGFDQGGALTEAVNKSPNSVVLLDEIEKAHPDVFNILLQIMDYGKLTDHNSRTVDFRNTILIMTSNVGAEALEKNSVGFTNSNIDRDNETQINLSLIHI